VQALHAWSQELENINAALDEAVRQDALGWLLPIATHVQRYLEMTGGTGEIQQRYGLLLACARQLDSPALELRAQLALGYAHWRLGDYAAARAAGEAARTLADALADRRGEAQALAHLARVEHSQGNFDAARELFTGALAMAREERDRSSEAETLNNLGVVSRDYDAARKLYEQSLGIKRELGDRYGEAVSLGNLGNVAFRHDNLDVARELYERALVIQRDLGNASGAAMSFNNLGNLAYRQGGFAAAEGLYREALALRLELGDRAGEARSLSALGLIEDSCGTHAAAQQLYARALTLRRELGDKHGLVSSCGHAGSSLAAAGQLLPAALTLAGAQHQAAQIPYRFEAAERESIDRALALIESAVLVGSLTAEDVAQWQAQGGAMSLDELAQYTLRALRDAPVAVA
jgi:tetratricopeptide (TPR) repeat protein